MSTKYNIPDQEKKRQDFWYENHVYAFDMKNEDKKPIFSIDTPPPTVSGKLHIGHIFSYTQAEAMARFKRMQGYNVFYPVGFDDNGIPTEILVEKELKIKIRDVERQEFIQKCLEVTKKHRGLYEDLMKSFGFSMDFTRAYSTISPEVQKIAQQRFIELYAGTSKLGAKISKKEFPALWCTKNQTTIAQAETEDKEFDEFFNDIRFTLSNGDDLIIATTRPELMPACVACFVHPEDKRYVDLIGSDVTTPFGTKVPLLGDEKVKMDKGTGVVMCCSYGDETDVYWIMKHQLPTKIIVNRYGKIENSGVEALDGLKIAEARKVIIEILEKKGAVVKRTAIVQSKAISERGKVPVEIIPVHQWFVDILDHKEDLYRLNDTMTRYPDFMKKRSTDWIENLEWDWNISRSRKFGIPIPVWYSKKTDEVILPSLDQLPIDPSNDQPAQLPAGHTLDDIYPETMVLDTWFTSGLTPVINQQKLQNDGCGINITPMTLRVQAHDIIRTWLLYTTLQSFYRTGDIAFSDVMISGHVLAGKGEKISKSKGNAKFGPEQLHTQFGADATRYWALTGQLGKDIIFDEATLKNGRKLIMKLRNSFNFVKMHREDYDISIDEKYKDHQALYPTDAWLIDQLHHTIEKMTDYLERYEFGLAKIAFEDFFWHDFCDNYLEIVKLRLYKPELFENGTTQRKSAQYTLGYAYNAIIKLIAPYLPHVTEAIYQEYFAQIDGSKSIHISAYPKAKSYSNHYTQAMDSIKQIISEVRGYKTENQLSLGADLEQLTIYGPQSYIDSISPFNDDIRGVTKAGSITYVIGDDISITCK